MDSTTNKLEERGRPPRATLAGINAATREEFVRILGGVAENSPWVAEEACACRPFDSVRSLHQAMQERIERAPRARQIELARLHPELAGREAAAGTLTAASNSEQGRLGLTSLRASDHARLTRLNCEYRDKFGFPFITAVRLHADLDSIFAALERRIAHEPESELPETLRQIGEVMRGRLARLFETPLGWLSTHVLDNVSGKPAAGVTFDLSVQEGSGWRHVCSGRTNDLGRTDRPVLADEAMVRGVYQLEVNIGDYFRGCGVALSDPPFLDRVPLRVGIADPNAHYHVPLACTPWTYSTYRGG